MMYSVNISVNSWYCDIEADSEDEAAEKALEFFLECCEPDIWVEGPEEEEI